MQTKADGVEGPKRPAMVGWYDPGQLMNTAVQVVVSTLFSENADSRLLEAFTFGGNKPAPHDYSKDENGQPWNAFWFDFMADTGDGWNPTYAVAYQMARATLDLQLPQDQGQGQGNPSTTWQTNRASVLVLGGDLVYPTPSMPGYNARFKAPFEAAFPASPGGRPKRHPHIFSIPGNHDWYDSLVSFTRLFVDHTNLGGWHIPQTRSYFALKLPGNWWLLGVDLQLGVPLDKPQIQFFQEDVLPAMAATDRIIVCTHEPLWLFDRLARLDPPGLCDANLVYFEKTVLARKIDVFLAGDVHYYMRHEDEDGCQKIVSGGGGAFLHPTHRPDVDNLPPHLTPDDAKVIAGASPRPSPFRQKASYPDAATSQRLCFRNLTFPWLNPKFGVVTALGYVMTAWACMGPPWFLKPGVPLWQGVAVGAYEKLTLILQSPGAVFWIVALFLAFWLFTDTLSRTFRFVMGTLHGLAHVLACLALSWLCGSFWVHVAGLTYAQPPQMVLTGLSVFCGGWIVGSLIMGLYLLVSLNVCGEHYNEAFSSLGIEDYKNFLRLRIDPDGTLTIFPVGIERVPKAWRKASVGDQAAGTVAEWVPDRDGTDPCLIEAPIVVAPRNTPKP